MGSLDFVVGMHAINNNWNTSAAPAHSGVSDQRMFEIATAGGAEILRIPLNLATVGPEGPRPGAVDYIGSLMKMGDTLDLKLIFEPGQTPPDLLPASGATTDAPQEDWQLVEMGERFGALVQAVHEEYGAYAHVVAGWEVSNEPNLSFMNDGVYYAGKDPNAPRFWSVGLDNARDYGVFLNAAQQAVDRAEVATGQSIQVIAAGVAHNDPAYFERVLQTLASLGGNVDAFAVHPYTTYDYSYQTPHSGRPTDWIPEPDTMANQWDFNFSFQGALYGSQNLLNQYGYSQADMWITEFGVPSYLGYRGAGSAGLIDQAVFYAEALGVMEAWGNSNLQGATAHAVLDNAFVEQNEFYNAWDNVSGNNGTTAIAEGSFGLFERLSTGAISEKPAAATLRAIGDGENYASSNLPILNYTASNTLDLSAYGPGNSGQITGYVALTHEGDDMLTGSAYGDSLFAGAGSDIVYGGDGDDRIYGGDGDDTLHGGAGDDDIYGGNGNDRINGGTGQSRIDGGTGVDTLVLDGPESLYSWSGDGEKLEISGGGEQILALNIERLYFTQSQTEYELANSNPAHGNGLNNGDVSIPPATSPETPPVTSPSPVTPSEPVTEPIIQGGYVDDIMQGTEQGDTIYSYEGDDIILSFDGDDTIYAAEGDDLILPGYGSCRIYGGQGVDTVLIVGSRDEHSINLNGLTVEVGGPGAFHLIDEVELIVFHNLETAEQVTVHTSSLSGLDNDTWM